ncbi:hypothetical protein Tco_0172736 [Tanacetum coccineum]
MVAYLKKPTRSEGFQEIVDFLNGSHIRIVDNGEQEINAIVDGKEFTITEASVRRHLQLADAYGIIVLPNTEIFDQLTLMGYVLTDDKLTFQKGKFSPQWRFLIHIILHCLSPKKTSWEQFSSNIATALVCLATNRTFKFSKLIFDGMVKNLDSKYKFLGKNKRFLQPHNRTYIAPTLTPKLFSNMKRGFSREHTPLFPCMLALQAEEGEGSGNPSEPQPPPSNTQPTHEEPIPNIESSSPQKTQSPRQALNKDTELPQTSVPIPNIPDEVVHQERGNSMEMADTTATSLEAMHDNSNIAKTQSTSTPTELISQETGSDGGNTPRSDEDSMTLQELTSLYTKLSDMVLALEIDLRQTKKVYVSDDDIASEASSKQGRMIEEIDQDVGVTLVTPTKVSSQKDQPEDQLGVLSAAKVLADAARVPTYSRRRRAVSTGSSRVNTASRRRRAVSTGSGGVSTASRIVNTAGMIQQVNIIIPSSSATKDKGKAIMTESEPEQTTTKLKQRQERAGYEAAIRLQEQLDQEEKEWDKYSEVDQARMLVDLINKRKIYFAAQKAEAKRNKPMTQAQQRTYMSNYIKHMGSHTMQQLKRYTFDELKGLFETTMKHARDNSRKRVNEGLNVSSLVMRENFEKLKIQEDVYISAAIKLQRYMHDPLKWRLYDTCVVNHVSTERGHDIFMRVEKDYPLTIALMTLMLSNMLQVDEYSVMADELLRKIFILANRLRQ